MTFGEYFLLFLLQTAFRFCKLSVAALILRLGCSLLVPVFPALAYLSWWSYFGLTAAVYAVGLILFKTSLNIKATFKD